MSYPSGSALGGTQKIQFFYKGDIKEKRILDTIMDVWSLYLEFETYSRITSVDIYLFQMRIQYIYICLNDK